MEKIYNVDVVDEKINFYKDEIEKLKLEENKQKLIQINQKLLRFWENYKSKKFKN